METSGSGYRGGIWLKILVVFVIMACAVSSSEENNKSVGEVGNANGSGTPGEKGDPGSFSSSEIKRTFWITRDREKGRGNHGNNNYIHNQNNNNNNHYHPPTHNGYVGGLSLMDKLSWDAADKLKAAARNSRSSRSKRSIIARLLSAIFGTGSRSSGGRSHPGGKLNRNQRGGMSRSFDELNHNYDAVLHLMQKPEVKSQRDLRIVANRSGVSCDDLCSPPHSVAGARGFCSTDYCRCSMGGTHNHISNDEYTSYSTVGHTEGSCDKGLVFDPMTLGCSDPSQTLLCS